VIWGPVVPVLEVELAEFPCQVHHSDGGDLWVPLQAEGGAQGVVDECPAHLDHLLKPGAVPLQALGELDERGVRVIHLEIELDGLKQHTLQGEYFLSGILPKAGELLIVGEGSNSFVDISNFLGSFLDFSSQEESTGGCNVSREVGEGMEHVESVEVDGASRHWVVAKSQSPAQLLDESGSFSAVLNFHFIVTKTRCDGWSVSQFLLFIKPIWHLDHTMESLV